ADDTVFMPSPLTHITGFLFGVLMPPMLGAAAVYLDIWDADTGLERIEADRCRFDGRDALPAFAGGCL
ncbi:MAG: AMP-binding protein, partial [Rhodospirillales bacterium]|nr:AMP-binding protein [Rhodospirillales bacterium]